MAIFQKMVKTIIIPHRRKSHHPAILGQMIYLPEDLRQRGN